MPALKNKKEKKAIGKKRGKKGKKQPKSDLSAEEQAEQEKKDTITALIPKTGMTEEELLMQWDSFHAQYPSGEITEKEFLETSKAGFLAESLFRVFDEDKSGNLSFYEFSQANNVTDLNSPEDKLNWIFTAFDQDGGGSIDVDEIRDIVVGLFRLAGIEEDEDLLTACISDVRDAVDQDGDGDISKEEFVKNAMGSKFIHNMLKG